jgi:hypothetical protein
MRPFVLALLAVPALLTTAAAERVGGKKGGGGALSRVSAGLSNATGGGGGSSTSTGGTNYAVSYDSEIRGCYDRHGRFYERDDPRYHEIVCPAYVLYSGHVVRNRVPPRLGPSNTEASLDFYAGAQKVHDSDGSASIEIAVTEERFRIGGTFTRYFERLQGGGMLYMSLPTLTGGVRIDDMGATAVFLEGGVAHARTSGDPMSDTKITGPIAGMRVEHALSKKVSLLGDVQQMWFRDEIRATAGRVAVRWGFVQAGLRVLDFNVGPALYGPEVGVRF